MILITHAHAEVPTARTMVILQAMVDVLAAIITRQMVHKVALIRQGLVEAQLVLMVNQTTVVHTVTNVLTVIIHQVAVTTIAVGVTIIAGIIAGVAAAQVGAIVALLVAAAQAGVAEAHQVVAAAARAVPVVLLALDHVVHVNS